MLTAYKKLTQRFKKINDFNHLKSVVSWDESTMMPIGGGPQRAQALATLAAHTHELLTAPEVGEWLNATDPSTLADPWDRMNLELMQREYTLNTALPNDLVSAHTQACFTSEQVWRDARARNDWQGFLAYQERTFALCYEIAEHHAAALSLSPYDAALAQYNRGETCATIDPVFKISSSSPPSPSSRSSPP